MNLTVKAKEQEIKQVELAIKIKDLEIDADRQSIELKRLELSVNDPLYAQKVAELEVRLKLIEVQQIENASKREAIDLLNKEIKNLKLYGDEKGAASAATNADTMATDANTEARTRNTAAINAQREAEGAGGGKYSSPLGPDKYGRPKGGSVTGNTREERLAGQAASDDTLRFELLEKLRAGTLTQADLPGLKAVVSSLKTNQAVFDSMPVGLSSLESVADDKKWANARTGFEQAISNLGGGSNGGTTVTVNIGGRKKNVGVSSQNDANTLVSVLRDLETQSNSAA